MKTTLRNLFCLFFIVFALSGCGTTHYSSSQRMDPAEAYRLQQLEWRRIYRGQLEIAASAMVQHIMKEISPQSGRNPRYTVHLEDIHYDETEHAVQASASLFWEARDFWSGVPYGECQTQGTLTVYMPIRSVERTQAKYSSIKYNKQVKDVSKREHLNWLDRGVKLYL